MPGVSENPGVLFDGSQASLHHDTTQKTDQWCPNVKISSEQLFFSTLPRHTHYLAAHIKSVLDHSSPVISARES